MNIPKKVKIGYKNYDINMQEKEVIMDNKVCYGDIHYDEGAINISTLHSEDTQKCTFIHECLHGIDDVLEVGLEEDEIRKLAKGIYSLIKDNPGVFTGGEN